MIDDNEIKFTAPSLNGAAMEEGKAERDYTRKVYQNLMDVVELLEKKAPLPVSQKQIAEATGISKPATFDICWNLARRGWAEEVGDGAIRLKKTVNDKDAWLGRMMARHYRDAYGVEGRKEE